MRHIAFGSLVALRYWISKKSRIYLEQQGITDMHAPLSDDMKEALEKQYLYPPGLRISAPLSNGRDPE